MDSIISQIQTLADNADEAGRNDILLTLRDLQYQMETPKDLFLRLYNSHLQVAVTYIGVELGLFKHLAKNTVLTVTELADISGASPELLERILRYLSSVGLITNVDPGQFKASKSTYVLADPLADAGLVHAFDTCGPAIQAFPSFLAETNYQNITSNSKTPFQKGFKTDLTCFQWIPQQPKLFDAMQKVMTALQSSDWISAFDTLSTEMPALPLTHPQLVEKPFFVDVGGGHGHQCVQLKEKHPSLHGRIILQDLPQAVEKLPPIDGVAIMTQNFFEKQAIEGARFYYLRRILHDWPDEHCISILHNLAAAMSKESRILIDEVVLPNVNVHWHAAMGDISMGVLFAGKERTKTQWEALVAESGLRLVGIHTYSVSLYSSIIALGL
ncbi:hypothetical protein V494_02134 [Pseudogymnoascus sp. VKM F-4513 (FW-928)]|nr:hypothetical protein V494_02134 [Pseudogymnoascus sp. VKM F-4513 (FW-928)]